MIHVFILNITIGLIGLITITLSAQAGTSGFSVKGEEWPGFWFSCEFARSQTAPDDGCKMFDDEGFQLAEGRLRYIRMIGSTETGCRGSKMGQCFLSSEPSVSISRTDRGKLTLGKKQFKVRYLGCSQIFYFADTTAYREIWPDKKRCFWAGKRRFYIAPYKGKVTIVK